MEDLLSVDEMAGTFDLIKDAPSVGVPVIKTFVGELLSLREYNDALKSVDFRRHSLIHYHVADFVLTSVDAHANKSGHPLKTDPCVILFNNSNVVLDQLPE